MGYSHSTYAETDEFYISILPKERTYYVNGLYKTQLQSKMYSGKNEIQIFVR